MSTLRSFLVLGLLSIFAPCLMLKLLGAHDRYTDLLDITFPLQLAVAIWFVAVSRRIVTSGAGIVVLGCIALFVAPKVTEFLKETTGLYKEGQSVNWTSDFFQALKNYQGFRCVSGNRLAGPQGLLAPHPERRVHSRGFTGSLDSRHVHARQPRP